mgnify:CR=1 FL=1
MPVKDMTGKTFGRLHVFARSENGKNGQAYWICKCECGNIKRVSGYKLRSGNTRSCGCYRDEIRPFNRRIHGMSSYKNKKVRIYNIWLNMKSRCNNPKNPEYRLYGGRGIAICDEWYDFEKFYKWAKEAGYRDDLTIDRINTNGNYEPTNCRWATRVEQQNNKRNNHILKYNGQSKTIAEWAEEVGIAYDTLWARIQVYGWSVEKALTTPVKGVV